MNSLLSTYWTNPFSSQVSLEHRIFFLLRFALLGCFVGHGIWGFYHKTSWLTFFEVFYISRETAYHFLPWIGGLDIAVGLLLFFRPNKLTLAWAIFWTVFTALLRPSAGMGMSEFFERAGNYGVPIAFFYVSSLAPTAWLSPITSINLTEPTVRKNFERILRWSLFSLLAGHGGLAFFSQSALLMKHIGFLGMDIQVTDLMIFGGLEMLLAAIVVLSPRSALLMLFVFLYKLATECLHPLAGNSRDVLETIERMGSYVIPLILFSIYSFDKSSRT